jgi:hypothetical protein
MEEDRLTAFLLQQIPPGDGEPYLRDYGSLTKNGLILITSDPVLDSRIKGSRRTCVRYRND